MSRLLSLALAALLFVTSVCPTAAQSTNAAVAGEPTQPPAKAKLAFSVFASGVQVYRCQQVADAPQWVFLEPKASLYEGSTATGKVVGTHGAGPNWRWNDGSAILGKVLAKQASPKPDAVPWLLLSATPSPGSNSDGHLQNITLVRRTDTDGGTAPATGCDPAHLNAESRVPYTATYTFYR